MLKKSTKALSAILSLSSVASVVAPVTTVMAATNIDALIATAEKSKSFYDFNQAYNAFQKLDAAGQKKYAAKMTQLGAAVQQSADVVALLEREVAFSKSGNAEEFNAILADINAKIANAKDKKYLVDELGAWGKKMLEAQPGYTKATDAIIAAWTAVLATNVDVAATQAAIAKAKEAVAALSHEGNKTYLTKDVTAIEAKLAAVVAAQVLKVESVKALNLKQVEIKFSKAVDKTEAEKEANYKVYNGGASTDLVAGGTATLQEDGKTVVITLGGNFNNGTTGKVVVSGIVSYTNDAVAVSDITVPTVVGVSVTGPKTFTVEYSEPITNLDAREYTVDDGNYIVTAATPNGSNKVDVTVGVNFTNGEHKVKVNGTYVADYAGYRIVPKTNSFTVAADTIAPTVTVKSVNPKQVKLVFSKPVTNVADANIKYRHTFNNDTYSYTGDVADVDAVVALNQPFVTQVSSTEYTLDFSQKPIALGNNKLYISYVSSSGTKIEDLWGNKLETVALDLNVELDTVKPGVTDVEFVDAQTLKVKFSETVDQTSAQTTSNYTIKDSTGTAVAVTGAVRGGTDNNEVTLTFAANALGGGNYTVGVKNVKDIAFVPNTMDEYTKTLSVSDRVQPTISSSTWAATGNNAKVYIPFSEQMDVSKLVKSNFIVTITDASTTTTRALGTDDTITIAGDGKSVELLVAHTAPVTGLDVKVGAVTDIAGNGLVGIVADSASGDFTLGTDSVAIYNVEATGTKTIKVTFSGRLSTVSAAGYSLVDKTTGTNQAVALSVVSHSINKDNRSEVVFNLGTALTAAARTTDALQLVVSGATGTKSYLGTQVSNLAYNGAATVADVDDKIVPTLTTVHVDSSTQITLTFSEAIEADTLAATLNGFTVAGGDAKLTAVSIGAAAAGDDSTDAATITLTGTGFIDGTTTVSYNAAAGLTDVAQNAVATFEARK